MTTSYIPRNPYDEPQVRVTVRTHGRTSSGRGWVKAFKWLILYPALITFAVIFFLHGGVFLLIGIGLVGQFRRRYYLHRRYQQQRAAARARRNERPWQREAPANPDAPYTNL
jgi:hypothetical protein